MMVVKLMKMVVLYVSVLVSKRVESHIIAPLIIAEDVVLCFNHCFRVTRGEFLQEFEDSDNTIVPITVDDVVIGTTGNIQDEDATALKILISTISRINFIVKK